MTMLKPNTRQKELCSTAFSNNLLSGTYDHNLSTLSRNSTIASKYPIVTPFEIIPIKKNQPNFKPETKYEMHQQDEQEYDWVDTKDIEFIIARSMETDIEQSIERNFGTERYFYGSERVCAERTLPIPDEIRPSLRQLNQRPNEQKVQVFYGYLSFANAVYYIIGQELYVFKIDELKLRSSEDFLDSQPFNHQLFKPVRIKQNCRKIHEVDFSENSNNKTSFKMPHKKALILEYPYNLEIVSYKFDQQVSKQSQNPRKAKKNTFSMINLGLNISMESEKADFITLTPDNSLLYMDQKGNLINCVFSQQDDKMKRKFFKQSLFSSKTLFVSKNKSFFQMAKTTAFQTLDFTHSFHLAKRKNIAMVYDERRSRVYTLTLKGDRSTGIQQLKKQINVYKFNSNNDGKIKSLLTIPESQILLEMNIPIDGPKVFVQTILKAQADYNQQARIIVLLSNGIKGYFQVINEFFKLRWTCNPPSTDSLKDKIRSKNNSLFEMVNLKNGKDSTNFMVKKWGEKFDVDSTKNNERKVFAFLNDRSLSVGLVRSENRFTMYMTLRKNSQKNDSYDTFHVNFKNDFFKSKSESFPSENQIFQTRCVTLRTETSQRFSSLEKFETMEQLRKLTEQKLPKPTSQGSHELLRQVHHGPRYFTYLSNKFIATFSLVRPIDIVYYFVKNRKQAFCLIYLPSIIGVEISEICYMLLQIYSAPKDTSYFISKNYIEKIDDILDAIAQNTEKMRNAESSFDFMKPSQAFLSKQKKRLQQKEKDQSDKLIEFKQEDTQDFKLRVRRLFADFNSQQRMLNQNRFERIKLKKRRRQSQQVDLDVNLINLSDEHKNQAKNCLIYMSRVLYPFWNAESLTRKNKELHLQTISKKVKELFEIVDLLKLQANEYWKHLNGFVQKLLQVIQIFIKVSKLPENFTLSEAVSKDIEYFEPFIFSTIHYNYQSKVIKEFQRAFPIYITHYFSTLIKIYEAIRGQSNVETITKILDRLDSYPNYFIDYLRQDKPFFDHTSLKVRDEQASVQAVELEVLELPFENLLPFFFKKVKDPTVRMTHKFTYLKLAQQKLQLQKKPDRHTEEVVSSHTLSRLQKEYDEIFRCLKFQDQCKDVIEEILQEEMARQSGKGTKRREKSGFFNSFFSRITGLFSSEDSNLRQSNHKKMSYQVKKKVHQENREIFQKLNYYAMTKKDFDELMQNVNSPYLSILYMNVFWNKNIKEADKINLAKELQKKYKDLVKKGYEKFGNILVAISDDSKQKARYERLISYIRGEVTKILDFLKSTQSQVIFPALYEGLTQQLSLHSFTYFSVQQINKDPKQRSRLYSLPTHLAQLGFNKQTISDYIIFQKIVPFLSSKEYLHSSAKVQTIKKWIYEWYMVSDMIKKYKKEDLQRVMNMMQDFKKGNAQLLKTKELEAYKKLLQKQDTTLYILINLVADVII